MIDKDFFGEMNEITIAELAAFGHFEIVGDGNRKVSNIATLKNATNVDLSFFGNRKYLKDLHNTSAAAVILLNANLKDLPKNVVGLVCSNVMIGYAKALEVLYPRKEYSSYVSTTANIHKSAKIGINCNIGNYVIIEENVEIGEGSVIGHNSVIGSNCKIGANAFIRNNVSISHSIIGANVIINSGARIGESGFGIIPNGEKMVYVPQLGRVIIGNHVRIGANTTIDRGSIEDTEIGDDTIIDNLVQFGHNVKVGKRSVIVAQVGIAGSTHVGSDTVIAGQVGIAGHVTVGDHVIIASKSGVASDVESEKIIGGIPAVNIDIWKRQVAFLKLAVTRKRTNETKKWPAIWREIWNKLTQKKH